MPNEETHVFLADQIYKKIKDKKIKEIIRKNKDYYLLGSVMPDVAIYGQCRFHKLTHGDGGMLTNKIIFDMLNKVKDDKDLAFVYGYLTHYAVDTVFHPVVYSLVGNHTDPKQGKSILRHFRMETNLNWKLNKKKFKFGRDVLFRHTVFNDVMANYGCAKWKTRLFSFNQRMAISLFKSSFVYYVFILVSKLGLVNGEASGMFEKEKNLLPFPQKVKYRDLITGKKLSTTLTELKSSSVAKGVKLINAANKYKKSKVQCKRVISGENFATGRTDKTVFDIKFTSFS